MDKSMERTLFVLLSLQIHFNVKFSFPLTGGTQACVDRDYRCYSWATYGYCRTNMYTRRNCQKSCRLCPRPPTVKPKPPTVRPKPPTVRPKPPTAGPKPPTARPKPSTSKPVLPSKGNVFLCHFSRHLVIFNANITKLVWLRCYSI